MPQSVLSANRVLELVAQPLERAELEERLFRSKAELADWTEDALTIEVTPDRLDMLSEGGLALFLQGVLGLKKGMPPFAEPPASLDHPVALVDASVSTIRPYLAGALLVPPAGVALDTGLFAEAIRFQEMLHATIGLDRRTASLGLYSWERLKSPLRYTLEPVDGVRFHPLDGPAEVEGSRFFAEHPMAQKIRPVGPLQWGMSHAAGCRRSAPEPAPDPQRPDRRGGADRRPGAPAGVHGNPCGPGRGGRRTDAAAVRGPGVGG